MRASKRRVLVPLLLALVLALPAATGAEGDEGNRLKLKEVRYSPGGARDPFAIPDFEAAEAGASRTTVDLQQIRYVGLLRTSEGLVALVEDAAGEGYALHSGDPIRGGRVTRISNSAIEAWISLDGVRRALRVPIVKEGD
ncbi:MAG: hypothetical protein JW819_06990 [Candidatus Krumholzibacteriota bacterium]|nr:hypothetical protein [Candidatus Krumholzibacteriota bacterium]